MGREELSRRRFLLSSVAGIGAGWSITRFSEILAAGQHVHEALRAQGPVSFEFFTPEQAAEVEGIAAQIIPSDGTPGAREARVIYFIDRALSTFDKDKQSLYVKGIQRLRSRERKLAPQSEKFSDLSHDQQIKLLKQIEKTAFFEQVRVHTVMGFLANPEYGGNHDLTGWKAIGFEDRFFYKPPFGYYDAEGK
jgi:gluconate 2-dehydrogenase gamma chain